MKLKRLSLSVFLVISIILAGCDDEEETKDTNPSVTEKTEGSNKEIENDVEKKPEDRQSNEQNAIDLSFDLSFFSKIEDVPEDTAGIIRQEKGPFAGVDVRLENVNDQFLDYISALKPLPENATEEELNAYFKYFYSLVAEDFPDPQDTIKKWEFGAFGNPDLPDSRFHFKENYNVDVLLDGSGSMATYIGDKTMMQIAKEAIDNFMKQVPEEANISLRVYGHKGTGSESDKGFSCNTIEQVYGYAPYDDAAFQKELSKIKPAGWTPLAGALQQAKEALAEFDTEKNTNLIYVVSDGIETCNGDPVAVAESLANSNAKPIINIIGFHVNNEAQAQLKAMAEVSGGIFSEANDQRELEEEFNRAEEVLEAWEDWKEDATRDVDAIETDNSFDILRVSNEWGRKETRQSNTFSRLLSAVEEQGIISYNQKKILRSMKNEHRELIENGQQQVINDLKNISAEKLEELKKIINEKYDQGTNG